jgi:hypothetical protein
MATVAEAPGELNALADALDSHRIITDADRMYGGQLIRSRILDRTSQGVDAEGQGFAAYSASYAKRKAKAGGRVDQVDLYGFEHHPHMLNAMLARPTEAGFEVGFYGEEAERARWNNEGGRGPERRFFAATEQDRADVKEAIGRRVTVRLQSVGSLLNLNTAVDE